MFYDIFIYFSIDNISESMEILGHPISSCRPLCIHIIFYRKTRELLSRRNNEKWEEVVQREGDYIFS